MGKKIEEKEKLNFALGRENYRLLAIGFAIIVIGFLLMLGEKPTVLMSLVRKFSVLEE